MGPGHGPHERPRSDSANPGLSRRSRGEVPPKLHEGALNSADMPRGVVSRCSALAVVQLGPFELRRAGCVFSGLYDHRGDEISLDEVERIAI